MTFARHSEEALEAYLSGKGEHHLKRNRYNTAFPQEYTPPSNDTTPDYNVQYNNMQYRQMRQPRQPMYTPAALRPTDPPSRPTDIPNRPRAPDTPPASKDSSFNSLTKVDSTKLTPFEEAVIAAGGVVRGYVKPGFEDLQLNLKTVASLGTEETDNVDEVTGPPITAHWKPDATAKDCAVCHVSFTWYFRRHHCRRCGDVICDNHSKRTIPLDQHARMHPGGHKSKACDPCYALWKEVKKLRHSRTGSLAESQGSSQDTTVPVQVPSQPRPAQVDRVGSIARSEGFAWSTF